MKGYSKRIRSIVALLRSLKDQGALEPAQTEAVVKAVKDLDRALRAHNQKRIESAINTIARVFVRQDHRGRSDR